MNYWPLRWRIRMDNHSNRVVGKTEIISSDANRYSDVPIVHRKDKHVHICCKHQVEYRSKTTWLEHVEFVHQATAAIPEIEVDLSTELFGYQLDAPFLIGAMTGGSPTSRQINRRLATAAEAFNVGLCVGSQRAMWEYPSLIDTYYVRDVATRVPLLGNIGIIQAAKMSVNAVEELIERIDADGLCLHLNFPMELAQPEGQPPPPDVLPTIRRLADHFGERLIVKEVGHGMSSETARLLKAAGVQTVDVAGAGGTSWVRVEQMRVSSSSFSRTLDPADGLQEWGIPTAASLLEVVPVGLTRCIASGGIRSGLDLAKAIALGADIGSASLPLLRRAVAATDESRIIDWLKLVILELKRIMALLGCRNVLSLQSAPLVVHSSLYEWLCQRGGAYAMTNYTSAHNRKTVLRKEVI